MVRFNPGIEVERLAPPGQLLNHLLALPAGRTVLPSSTSEGSPIASYSGWGRPVGLR